MKGCGFQAERKEVSLDIALARRIKHDIVLSIVLEGVHLDDFQGCEELRRSPIKCDASFQVQCT